MGWLVELKPYECEVAAFVGSRRQAEAWYRGLDRRSPHFASGKKISPLQTHIEGAGAECAVSKVLLVPWNLTINTFKKGPPDVGLNTEVRWRDEADYDLIIRPDDIFEREFVLVKGRMPLYRVRGYIRGEDAKQDRWWKNPGGFGWCWCVPEGALRAVPNRARLVAAPKLEIVKRA